MSEAEEPKTEQVDRNQDGQDSTADYVEFKCAKRFRVGRDESLRTTDVGEVLRIPHNTARRFEQMNKGAMRDANGSFKKADEMVAIEQERLAQIAANIGRDDGNPAKKAAAK